MGAEFGRSLAGLAGAAGAELHDEEAGGGRQDATGREGLPAGAAVHDLELRAATEDLVGDRGPVADDRCGVAFEDVDLGDEAYGLRMSRAGVMDVRLQFDVSLAGGQEFRAHGLEVDDLEDVAGLAGAVGDVWFASRLEETQGGGMAGDGGDFAGVAAPGEDLGGEAVGKATLERIETTVPDAEWARLGVFGAGREQPAERGDGQADSEEHGGKAKRPAARGEVDRLGGGGCLVEVKSVERGVQLAMEGGISAEAGAGFGVGAEERAEFGCFRRSQAGLRPGIEEDLVTFVVHESSEVPRVRSTQVRRVWRARVRATRTELGVQPTAGAMSSGICPRW